MSINDKTTLQFDDDFLKEEVRCGYKVTKKLKKTWAIELDLMDQLIKICNKYDIKIFVFAGTLLGAIRHKGFIPWDDDFDVIMTRKDFAKLQEVAPKEFKYPYFLQTNSSDKQYFIGYGRFRNSLTTAHILDYKSENYNEGIYIDVYVADGYVDDDNLLNKQIKKLRCFQIIENLYRNNSDSKNKAKRLIKSVLIFFCSHTLFRFVRMETVDNWYEKEITKYTDVSDMMSTITHPINIIKRAAFSKKEFDKIIYMPFENIMVPVPAGYDEMLKRMYGNYMEFPPEKDRGEWHNNVIYFDPDTPYKEYFAKKRYAR